jgi:DNA topoisomerase-1
LRDLGTDPVSGATITVREGRFGPYVTDGETNASLRKGDSIEEITIARAAELLAERRARGPATPRKRAAKKTAAKKTAAKKTATKKTAAKRSSPRKSS